MYTDYNITYIYNIYIIYIYNIYIIHIYTYIQIITLPLSHKASGSIIVFWEGVTYGGWIYEVISL